MVMMSTLLSTRSAPLGRNAWPRQSSISWSIARLKSGNIVSNLQRVWRKSRPWKSYVDAGQLQVSYNLPWVLGMTLLAGSTAHGTIGIR